ncbi:VanZ family protein [Nocardia stercoris]|uniref:VanZ family protein n=1 Tax=Nocardia stercoris TaxID=2483361 RepID=A0A3M2LCW0_9NOCA|nr:VanZ family protein [Nocardia stercoris]RMI35322.1 VanZ family protein [Nocardia stercoris]
MNGTWETWGGVVVAAIAAIPVAGLVAWWLAGRRGWRAALCDVGMVTGTAPWLWMIFTPTGSGRSVNLVPLRDLAEQLADDRAIEQFGGNLLVFAALGFLLPVRLPWFARSYRILLAGAAASIAVETAQFALDIGRHSSVDDVLLNAAGACLAAQFSRHLWAPRAGTARSEPAWPDEPTPGIVSARDAIGQPTLPQ